MITNLLKIIYVKTKEVMCNPRNKADFNHVNHFKMLKTLNCRYEKLYCNILKTSKFTYAKKLFKRIVPTGII